MGPIGMAGLQAGAKAVDGLVDIGVNSLNEALWGDYYRDKEVEQSQRLLDQQTEAQSKLMKQNKDQQLAMWNATNYGAQTAHLQAAGLNPALMYGDRWEVAREAKDKVTAAVSEKYQKRAEAKTEAKTETKTE